MHLGTCETSKLRPSELSLPWSCDGNDDHMFGSPWPLHSTDHMQSIVCHHRRKQSLLVTTQPSVQITMQLVFAGRYGACQALPSQHRVHFGVHIVSWCGVRCTGAIDIIIGQMSVGHSVIVFARLILHAVPIFRSVFCSKGYEMYLSPWILWSLRTFVSVLTEPRMFRHDES